MDLGCRMSRSRCDTGAPVLLHLDGRQGVCNWLGGQRLEGGRVTPGPQAGGVGCLAAALVELLQLGGRLSGELV